MTAAEDLYVANMWTAAGKRISTQEIFQKDAPEAARAFIANMPWAIRCFAITAMAFFKNKGASAGVEMGRWSWSSDAWDFDHDGFPDLYITNGMVSGHSREDLNSFFWRQVVANSPTEAKPAQDYERGWNAINELIRSDGTWSGFERNVFYANNRDGTFSDVSGAVGMDFLEDGRSFALADFDHDGRLEVFLKNRNGPQLRVLKNVMKDLPPSISFRLQGWQEQPGRYRRRGHGGNRFEASDSLVCRPDQDFFPSTARNVFFGLGRGERPGTGVDPMAERAGAETSRSSAQPQSLG